MPIRCLFAAGFLYLFVPCGIQAAFVHPGCLSTQADLDRMTAKVAAGEQPWKGSWDILVVNSYAQLSYTPNPQVSICAGGVCSPENYMTLARDCAAAYQCALRYHGSGNTAYADKAVQIMNAWASTLTEITGDTNASLRAGLYGYQFACAGELMRNYSGWVSADFTAFQNMMVNIFYDRNTSFLTYHHGTCDSHYWANWDLANVASMMAIGVLVDRQDIFDEGLNYFYSGVGTGNINNAVHYIHPDGFGQWQESGRDQGHALMGPQLMGVICEIGWNQGIDLYGHERDKFLSACEYISKYNLWYDDVPWITYINCEYEVHSIIASWGSRGAIRPGWDMLYNHYVNRLGMSAPYTAQYAERARPEGGGGNYGSTSGGFDGLGFTTLTHSLDPIASGAVPSGLLPHIKGSQVTLSWRGSAYASSYNVKRSTTSGGPYTTLATVGSAEPYYIDPGLTTGITHYYVVSANNPGGESANSTEVAATADGQLYGAVIGTDGSWSNKGATKYTVFDGSLRNFFDPPSVDAWVGLDLGEGISAVITQVKYCPRAGFSGRMVGGKFQGSDTADFSSGVVDLYTITAGPPDGVLTTQNISNGNSFRYLRYLAPSTGDRWCNVAEVQFLGNVSGLSAPAAPSGASATLVNGFHSNITWNAVTGATSYKVKRATTVGGPYIIVRHVTGTNYLDSGLSSGTTYYYVVSALNSAGQSVNSSEFCVTTQSPGPILVANYTLEGNTDDSTINNYHAAATGSPVYISGQVGQAVDLDGTDDFVTLPSNIIQTDNCTITAWMNWDGGGDWQRVFDFGNNTAENMFLTPQSGGGTLRFAITTSGGGGEQQLNTSPPATGQWVHVAVTLEDNIGTLYVNGTPANTNTAMTINPTDFPLWNNYIGQSQYPDPLFDGRIDDFRIYNYALSDAAVAKLAKKQMDIEDLSDLASWWLSMPPECGTDSDCLSNDLSGDGKIDLSDLAEAARRWL